MRSSRARSAGSCTWPAPADEPYTAGGLTHRTFYGSPYQLKKVEPVGRMGARNLFDEPDDA